MYERIKDIDIYYERCGSGRPVLILHGWGCNTDVMRSVSDYVASVGREAISIDFPGFGKTAAPQDAWSVYDYADATYELIQRLGIQGCDVMGHSFGGRIIIILASRYPELFGRLILVDAAGIRPKRSAGYYARVYVYKLGKLMKRSAALDKLFGISKRQANAGSEDYKALSGVMKQVFVKVVNEDLAPLLKSIRNETLLIWGSEDNETPMYMAKRMERDIADCGLAVINGAGHFSFLDGYGQFCSIIKVFLEDRV